MALDDDYVSVTPIRLQFTVEPLLEPLQILEQIGADLPALEGEESEVFQEVDAELEKILESRATEEKQTQKTLSDI